jgi:hypothetical protein
MAKTRVQRKQELAIPDSFVPQFWDRIDGRFAIVREIRRRYDELKSDTGADSAQKDLLVQRAVFISVQLETMECVAAESGKLDSGVYTQMTNCLHGLLRQLGLERKKKDAGNLRSYLEDRE